MKVKINNKGMSLVSVMMAAGLGLIVTAGLSKALVGITERSMKASGAGALNEIRRNLTSILRSKKAWLATVHKAPLQSEIKFNNHKSCPDSICAEERCFPGTLIKNEDGERTNKYCPLDFWYNPTSPDSQEEYNNANLVKWVYSVNKYKKQNNKEKNRKRYGLAFFTVSGKPLILQNGYEASSICNYENENFNPETCFLEQYPEFKNKYIRVRIDAPIIPSEGYSSLPNFKITIQDFSFSKKVLSFYVFETLDQMLDSNKGFNNCYKETIRGLEDNYPDKSTGAGSKVYYCDHENGYYLISASCTGTKGLWENTVGLSGVSCNNGWGSTPIEGMEQTQLSMLCCRSSNIVATRKKCSDGSSNFEEFCKN